MLEKSEYAWLQGEEFGLDSLAEGSTNYIPWIKYGPLPVSVNKVLLAHICAHSLTYGLRLLLRDNSRVECLQ